MFVVTVENPEALESVTARIQGVLEDIDQLHREIPDEFVKWQTEDMRRTYPNLEQSGESWFNAWTTLIWPRSRRSNDKQYARQRGPKRTRPRAVFGVRVRAMPGYRPILRDVLFDKLRDRMVALLDKITWAKKR